MKILLLGLLPIILLSVVLVRHSILFYGIGIPVLPLWIISALVRLIPADLSREATRGLLSDAVLNQASGMHSHQEGTQRANQAA